MEFVPKFFVDFEPRIAVVVAGGDNDCHCIILIMNV